MSSGHLVSSYQHEVTAIWVIGPSFTSIVSHTDLLKYIKFRNKSTYRFDFIEEVLFISQVWLLFWWRHRTNNRNIGISFCTTVKRWGFDKWCTRYDITIIHQTCVIKTRHFADFYLKECNSNIKYKTTESVNQIQSKMLVKVFKNAQGVLNCKLRSILDACDSNRNPLSDEIFALLAIIIQIHYQINKASYWFTALIRNF